MVTHIVLWNFKEELDAEQRKAAGERIKALLEPIRECVPGAMEIRVETRGLPSGNKDLALISTFVSAEALAAYQVHPAHAEAGKYVGSVTCGRACMDFER